jgi:anti-sigma regulatory factor (Ser/Thr protein kinase)
LVHFEHGLDSDRACAAGLLLCEIVTNAVRHGRGGFISLNLDRDPGRFRAEVVDHGSGFSFQPRDTEDLETPGGWGLHLVDVLSDRWGAHQGSTHVWFEMAVG